MAIVTVVTTHPNGEVEVEEFEVYGNDDKNLELAILSFETMGWDWRRRHLND